MSEQTSTAVAGEQNEQSQERAKEFEAITSQDDFDARIQARIARERGRFADYDDLKASAAKLAEIEAANKTESEKVAERLAAAEKRAVELEAKATRAEVAAAKGVPAELLNGSTQAELEASADALNAFTATKAAAEPAPEKQTYFVPDEGGIPALGKQDNISPGMGSLRAAYAQEKSS